MNYLQRNMKELCLQIETAINEDGTLNVTEAARKIGIGQPTLKRILDGKHMQIRMQNEEKICNYFRITREDLYGSTPITEINDDKIREAIAVLNRLPYNEHLRAISELDGINALLNKTKP